ncbi:MAG: FAD-binding oxidoreductase [Pseudomonadota bacterium]|nr:FAD-binding oxidoreductase [Pseudomonadota bacterium]
MQKISQEAITHFQSIVGDKNVRQSPNDLEHMGKDWSTVPNPRPSVILLPSCTKEVSEILRYCNEQAIKVVPSGGRTGLVGGAMAVNGEVVLSLQRMNKIIAIDSIGMFTSVEAGVNTQALQLAAKEHGVMFGLDLGSAGSSLIGGNISTNAAGKKFIRNGGMRQQVLGLEVVLADGRVLNLKGSLRKDNTGYALEELFIGAEGTLGIITKATLRLQPLPAQTTTLCCVTDTFQKVLRTLELCHLKGLQVNTFEFFSRSSYEAVRRLKELKPLFDGNCYMLIVLEGGNQERIDAVVEQMFSDELVSDGLIAQSPEERLNLWTYRDMIVEAVGVYKVFKRTDVSLPIPRMGEYLNELMQRFASRPPSIDIIAYGHVGDGNFHIDYISNNPADRDKIIAMEREQHELVSTYNGSISAEHGIGLLKKPYLNLTRSEEEINLMRNIKQLLDPVGILNPGKIFDL